jgi:uncharacterized protein GlcG (DUF336 family)
VAQRRSPQHARFWRDGVERFTAAEAICFDLGFSPRGTRGRLLQPTVSAQIENVTPDRCLSRSGHSTADTKRFYAAGGLILVAFQRMDGATLASIQIAQHKARAAVTFRRPTKVFEDGVQLMHLNYLLAFDGIIASRGGIPLIDQGDIIGAIGCSGGTDSQDEVVSKAGAAVINQLPTRIK